MKKLILLSLIFSSAIASATEDLTSRESFETGPCFSRDNFNFPHSVYECHFDGKNCDDKRLKKLQQKVRRKLGNPSAERTAELIIEAINKGDLCDYQMDINWEVLDALKEDKAKVEYYKKNIVFIPRSAEERVKYFLSYPLPVLENKEIILDMKKKTPMVWHQLVEIVGQELKTLKIRDAKTLNRLLSIYENDMNDSEKESANARYKNIKDLSEAIDGQVLYWSKVRSQGQKVIKNIEEDLNNSALVNWEGYAKEMAEFLNALKNS